MNNSKPNQNNIPKSIEDLEFYKKDQTISNSFLPHLNNVSINPHTLDRLKKKLVTEVINANAGYVNGDLTKEQSTDKLITAINKYTENIINELELKTNVYVQGTRT